MKVHKKAHHNHVLLLIVIIFGLGFYAGRVGQTENRPSQTIASNAPSTDDVRPTDTMLRATSFKTNQACIDIIKESEAVHLKAYRGPSGKWLIGYGHGAGVRSGMTISLAKAEQFLQEDLAMIEGDISNRLKTSVTRNQFSAMVCLAYNIGTGNFATSSVLRETNAGNFKKAAEAFLMWNKVRQGNDLVVSAHLDKRRKQERSLYLAAK
ncbi:MAG: lysozyme [Alphaproteobacteria bacterium]|nr:MAG: lysozyme [Alphaproteobacteria bacterium]